jgi:hypothetical protein
MNNITETRFKYYSQRPQQKPARTIAQTKKSYLAQLQSLFDNDVEMLAQDQAILNAYKAKHPQATAIANATQQRINNRITNSYELKRTIAKIIELDQINALNQWATGNQIGRAAQIERSKSHANKL